MPLGLGQWGQVFINTKQEEIIEIISKRSLLRLPILRNGESRKNFGFSFSFRRGVILLVFPLEML